MIIVLIDLGTEIAEEFLLEKQEANLAKIKDLGTKVGWVYLRERVLTKHVHTLPVKFVLIRLLGR